MGFAQLLEFADLEEQHKQKVAMILKASRHLLGIVDEVLDISRVEEGRLSISAEAIAVQPLIDDALDLTRPLADGMEVVIHDPALSGGDSYVFADNQRLKQVLINLIANAIKYNRRGGEVSVAVASVAGSDRVRISVADTGPGLDQASIEKLFVPFERLDAAVSGIEGTGLGLAVSRSPIEAMGGTIAAASTPGAGSVFWVELDRSEALAVEVPVGDEDPLLAVRAYPGEERRLLYIEDAVANVQVIEGILERRPTVRLIPAMLGRPRPRARAPPAPDPPRPAPAGSVGRAGTRRVAEGQATRDIPVAILSADATRDRAQFLAAGTQAYLTKPIDLRRLREIFDQFLAVDREAVPVSAE